jgi:excisionase family DNA binding protein
MITVPEAARRSGRNPETIRRWIRSGRLRSEKVGTQHLVSEGDLAGLLDDDRPLILPSAWEHTDDGRPMPAWEQLVRDGRDSH